MSSRSRPTSPPATITVGGTATETFSGSATTYTVTVATPVSFPIDFPAG